MNEAIDRLRRREGLIYLAAFALCIPAANWLILHVGTICAPQGPCLIPVGRLPAAFGLACQAAS